MCITVESFDGTLDLNRFDSVYWAKGKQANLAQWQDLSPEAGARLEEIQTKIEKLTEEAAGIILAAPPAPGTEPEMPGAD